MTVVKIDVDGKEVELYCDNNLYKQIEQKIKPSIHQKDKDRVYIIDGPEGSGKSVFAMQFAKLLDPSFDISKICFTPKEFLDAIVKAEKGDCIIFDEAFTGLSSRATLSEINKMLVSLMMEMRQKNLFVVICLPSFFFLEKYVVLFRSKGLFHVYEKKGKRGQWVYFNRNKMRTLYILGKKFLDYSKPKSLFKGRFFDKYTVDEVKYRELKKKALEKKTHTKRQDKYIKHRDALFWIMYKQYRIPQKDILKHLKNFDIELEPTSLSDAIKRGQKEIDDT